MGIVEYVTTAAATSQAEAVQPACMPERCAFQARRACNTLSETDIDGRPGSPVPALKEECGQRGLAGTS